MINPVILEPLLLKIQVLMTSMKYLHIYICIFAEKNHTNKESSTKKNMTINHAKVQTSLILDKIIKYLHNQSYKQKQNSNI